jgi:adenosylcobinamide-phosphate synthase
VDRDAIELPGVRVLVVSAPALLGGYAADLVLGDPARLHPVAGFGKLALAAERALYAPTRRRGAIYAVGLIASAAMAGEAVALAASRAGLGRGVALLALTWAALGGRSLRAEAIKIAASVDSGDLDRARAELPALVGRDPQRLDGGGISRAVVESVAENTSDAVVGALLWGAAAGPAGVSAYRAANTLDAIVGRRSERYERFGWAAARIDDAMNWPAARLGAALTVASAPAVGGSSRRALRVLRRDGGAHPSPNAGWMEASFAGALGVRLGGPLSYAGRLEQRPSLGDGAPPSTRDVRRAARLSSCVGATAVVLCACVGAARERIL